MEVDILASIDPNSPPLVLLHQLLSLLLLLEVKLFRLSLLLLDDITLSFDVNILFTSTPLPLFFLLFHNKQGDQLPIIILRLLGILGIFPLPVYKKAICIAARNNLGGVYPTCILNKSWNLVTFRLALQVV